MCERTRLKSDRDRTANRDVDEHISAAHDKNIPTIRAWPKRFGAGIRMLGRSMFLWRKGWDSNPRCPCRHAGFQDRCLKPLGHPSKPLTLFSYSRTAASQSEATQRQFGSLGQPIAVRQREQRRPCPRSPRYAVRAPRRSRTLCASQDESIAGIRPTKPKVAKCAKPV